MIERILKFSVEQRFLVLGLSVMLVAVGAWSFAHLPIDAVPDITNVQVQINTAVPSLSPVEVEKLITFPVEWAMGGLPRVEQVRSLSRFGLSQVTVIFEDGTDIYWARQLVSERLVEAREQLPEGMGEPVMGPISTGLGEINMWGVVATGPRPDGEPYTATDLRTIQDWVVRPQVRTVPGVVEVNTIGGFERQIHVTPDPQKLIAYGLSFRDVLEALAANNANVGGGYIERQGEQNVIRSPGRVSTPEEIESIVLGTHHGVPVYVRDVAAVGLGRELRTGSAGSNGEEIVNGTAIMLMGENSRTVSRRVAERLEAVGRGLPENVEILPLYDRTNLVNATLRTVEKNLLEGALLVIAILFLMLGNIRAAVIAALGIPLSMFFAVTGMVQGKVSGNLMSLGAIDFGLIIDGAIIIVENCVRRLAERQQELGRTLSLRERLDLTYDASRQVRRATMFGELIIMIVYLPILTLTGIEGKMFRPMAVTVVLALAGATILSMTVIPALCAVLLRKRIREKEVFLVRWAQGIYRPVLDRALRHRATVLLLAVAVLGGSGLLATRLGTEFIPSLDEGDFAIHAMRIPSIGIEQSTRMQQEVERALLEIPEVAYVFSKTGTAEVATDPMPPGVSDTFTILKPRGEWPDPTKPKERLAEEISRRLEDVPGNLYEFTQPIEMRFNELISGVRSDIAVKVFGDETETMLGYANRVAAVLRNVEGARDVKVEQVTGLPVLTLRPDRDRLARYGLNVADVQDLVKIALGGMQAGEIIEGDRRFPLVVRLPERLRNDLDAIRMLPVPIEADGDEPGELAALRIGDPSVRETRRAYVPLATVANISIHEGPNQVSREDGKRRIVVQANVRGRDIGGFVREAQERVNRELGRLDEGYWLGWGGQFENLISARRRLMVVVPLALFLIFFLLYATFNAVTDALLVFTGVPLALTGGILSLWLRDIPFSISAAVGFIALSGVAVLNGLVMLTFINQLVRKGKPIFAAVVEGSILRLRPVLMTAMVASFGFVPMALATGRGAEVQRPLATVVIGGLISSTLLTLVVLPVLYTYFHRKPEPGNGKERSS